MTMRHYGDIMASVGKFTDDDGMEAKRWAKGGVLMKDDAGGGMSIRLDLVPVSPDWSGWLAVRNVDKGESQKSERLSSPNHYKPTINLR